MSNKLSFFVSFELNGKILYKVSEAELALAISAVMGKKSDIDESDITAAIAILKMDVVRIVRGG